MATTMYSIQAKILRKVKTDLCFEKLNLHPKILKNKIKGKILKRGHNLSYISLGTA